MTPGGKLPGAGAGVRQPGTPADFDFADGRRCWGGAGIFCLTQA